MSFVFSWFLFPIGAASERQEFDIKPPPLGVPLLLFHRGYLLWSFRREGTSAR